MNTCENCGLPTDRTRFCSNSCAGSWGRRQQVRPKKEKPEISCTNCGASTSNPKFCSKSCAATWTNINNPRRKRIGKCQTCGVPIRSGRRYCPEHKWGPRSEGTNTRTLEELRGNGNAIRGNYRYIRETARRAYAASGKPRKCLICGYSLHVDTCHIKGINSFSPETPVNIMNDLSNLIALCRNHHWEFDNGYIDPSEMSRS